MIERTVINLPVAPGASVDDQYASRRMQGVCFDCGRRYGDEFGFPDLVIPNEAWDQISPTRDSGGLLCPSCICRRLYLAGISTTAYFGSGPLELMTDNRAISKRLRAALSCVLPMAKGYAAAHPVGRNAEKIEEAEAALAPKEPT